jgi:hypothetical protein
MLAQSTVGLGATAEQIRVTDVGGLNPSGTQPHDQRRPPVEKRALSRRGGSLRRLARQTRFPEVRQELFDLAEGFDRMAEFPEKWQTADRQP